MTKKKDAVAITQEKLRTTFAILRSQLRLAEPGLRIRAIHEFQREIFRLYEEEVDRRAQAAGRSHEQEMQIVHEEATRWIANQPESTS